MPPGKVTINTLMKAIDPIGTALQGLLRAEDRVAKAADRVSKGDFSAEALVEAKLGELDYKVQARNLKNMTELEDEILDILA